MKNTKSNLSPLENTKLFDAEKLKRHIEDKGCTLYLERPQFASWEEPYYTFSLVTPDSWMAEASISKVMEYLVTNNILDDSDIIHSWEAHNQWYTQLHSVLGGLPDSLSAYGISFPYELHPNNTSVSDCYVYGGDTMVIKFIEILLVMSDVSVSTDSMESQQIIMDDAVGFAVNELIPALNSENKVSSETATALMQKVYEHISKLLWIYCL